MAAINIPITALSGAQPLTDGSGYRFVVQFLDSNGTLLNDARLPQNQTFVRTNITPPFTLVVPITDGAYTIPNLTIRVHSDSTGSGKYQDKVVNLVVAGGYAMSISSISHTVTGTNPPQAAPACFFAINITEPSIYQGVKNFILKIYQSGNLLQEVPLTGIDTSAYPAIIFEPKNVMWSFNGPGSYTLQLSTVYSGITYQDSKVITLEQSDFDCGTGGTGEETEGFVITGVGQNVTGAYPQLPFHTVALPERVINLVATPAGTYSGSVTINGHTFTLTNLVVSSAGYPAVFFNPTNPFWDITTAGTYAISISLVINGTTYTQTTSTVVSNADLGIVDGGNSGSGSGVIEPSDPNPDVEMIVDPYTIKGRFKISGGSGTYNVTVKLGGNTISTGTAAYGTYAEHTIKRFHNQGDLAGVTLVWSFEKAGITTNVTFFTPEIVHREYRPEVTFDGSGNAIYNNFEDQKLMIRYTKPFNSPRIRLEDVGSNLSMQIFYYVNGSIYRDSNGNYDASVLSPRLVPALRYVQILKFFVDTAYGNINDPTKSLYYDNTFYNKSGARAECWFRTAANQNVSQI